MFDAALPATLVEAHADSGPAPDAGVLADLDHLAGEQQEATPPAVESRPVPAAASSTTETDEVVVGESEAESEAVASGDAEAASAAGEADPVASSDVISPPSVETEAETETSGSGAMEPASTVDEVGAVATDDGPALSDTAESDEGVVTDDLSVASIEGGAADSGDHASESGDSNSVQVDDVEESTSVVEAVELTVERVEIVFVDALVDDAADGLQWHPGEVYVLDANRDGVEQIAEVLNGRTGIDAVHIISHGSAGSLTLGSATLNSGSLSDRYASEMLVIASALSQDADLLLYGCDVAATEAGVSFVEALALATGADVAASNGDTGAASLGGDWVLEARNANGVIETVVISAEAYAGLLTTTVNSGSGALLAVQSRDIYSIDIVTGKATLLTTVPATVGGVSTGNDVNSLAVDQVNGLIYYTSNNSSSTNVALFAYNFNTNTHILVDNNLTNNGIVVGATGVGSGGAVFANGTLYLGIENNQGGDGTGTTSDDTIYRLTFSNSGTVVSGVTVLVNNITGNDWGDLGYNPATNTILSVSSTTLVRYNATTGAFVDTSTVTAGFTQQGYGINGQAYGLGTQIQQYNPLTGANIGSAINITTNGTTLLPGAVFDAAGWVPPSGTIGDRIFTDNNANGVFDGTDTGIANVTVRLIDDVNNNGVFDAGERILATDTTDASGNYLFGVLPNQGVLPGNYIVQVTDANGVLGTGRSYTTAGYVANSLRTIDADMTRIGSSNLSVDFGLNNRPPVDDNETNVVIEDTTLTVADGAAGDLLNNATDPDGGTLTITQFTVNGTTVTAGQTVTMTGIGALTINANGSYNFVPALNFTGTIPVATYTVSDVGGLTDTSTLRLTMIPVNDPPVDGDETNTVTEDTTLTVADGAAGDLLNNASDVDGDTPLTITQFTVNGTTVTAGQTVTMTGIGALTINANGSYNFVPALNFTGTIPVATYTVSDGNSGTDTSTLTLTMIPVNDPPVDGDETNTVIEDTTLTVVDGQAGPQGDLLNNATDVDGGALTITQFTIAGSPTVHTAGTAAAISGVGSLQINANGSYSFTPALNYTGPIPVATYTVSDGAGGTDTSTLTLTITPVNDPPVDGDETNTVIEDTTLTVVDGQAGPQGDLLNNATDVDGGALTITQFTIAGSPTVHTAGTAAAISGVGSLQINANGSYSFTPALNYTGPIPVATHPLADGAGGTATPPLTLTHPPGNDPPGGGDGDQHRAWRNQPRPRCT
ncbi:cadherin-like domain-containing protein, partial [Hydrogenophaga crassostreae]|uniref:cadherin-like domain-containing protein n=1 Tax=Hydrogenophaga crassostreae TaxID=1763535 RepID=UPI001E438F68